MEPTRSLYEQNQFVFWAVTLASTVWILNLGMTFFEHSVNPLAGLVVPSGLFWMVWVIIWHYLREQRNPLCFLGNLSILVAMAGYILWGLSVRIALPEFLHHYLLLSLVGPVMGTLGTGLLVLGLSVNRRLHQTSPLVLHSDSTI